MRYHEIKCSTEDCNTVLKRPLHAKSARCFPCKSRMDSRRHKIAYDAQKSV